MLKSGYSVKLTAGVITAGGCLGILIPPSVLLIVGAAFAHVDEVTRGEAKVVPTSQVQILQSVDGGVVESLNVREGDLVEVGQLLLRVDSTRFVSSARESL